MKKIFLTAAFGLLFVCGTPAQEDFEKIFAEDYARAIQFIAKEKWMTERINGFGLAPKEVLSVVFPELIRFNAIQDKIETFALESLYIKYGKDYANFSIGPFQIKPSFVENLEKDYLNFPNTVEQQMAIAPDDTLQTEMQRAARLKRIKDIGTMLNYVCFFYKLMEERHPGWTTSEDKIKFIATAYNCGYQKPESEIKSFVKRKFFHTGMVSLQRYAYAEVSWYFYNR